MFRVTVLLLICPAILPAQEPVGAGWPSWRGPHGDGRWQAPALAESWPKDGLKTVWSMPVGGGYAGVSVARGKVLVLDRETGPLDSKTSKPNPSTEKERLICIDADSGQQLWIHSWSQPYGKLDYGTGPRAAATIDGKFVFVLGALGQLRCVRLEDGRLVWSKDLVKAYSGRPPDWGYAASPLIYRGHVIVQAGGPDGYSVIAFHRETGEVAWHSLSDEAGYAWPIPVRRRGADTDELVLWTPSHVRGIQASNGRPLWGVPYRVTYGVSIATPIFQDEIALVCGYWEGSRAIRLGEEPGSATLLWEDRMLRGLMSQPLYRDGKVFLLDRQSGIVCFELATGQRRWNDGNTLTPRGRNPQASLVWTGHEDQVLALNSEGELVLCRFGDDGYSEQARAKIIEPTWAHPAFAADRVYARSDAEIVCVELPKKAVSSRTGHQINRQDSP